MFPNGQWRWRWRWSSCCMDWQSWGKVDGYQIIEIPIQQILCLLRQTSHGELGSCRRCLSPCYKSPHEIKSPQCLCILSLTLPSARRRSTSSISHIPSSTQTDRIPHNMIASRTALRQIASRQFRASVARSASTWANVPQGPPVSL